MIHPAFLLLALAAVPSSDERSEAAGEPVTQWAVGEPAPHVHLPTIDGGDPIELADFRGERVLLAEFASW